MSLRPYQIELKNNIRQSFQNGVQSVILCSPTGSGKTVTFADICRDTVKNGFRVLVVVDRKELTDQSVAKLTEYGLKPEVITGGKKWINYSARCYVATVQTLKRRNFPFVDLVVIDEAHKQIFDDVVREYLSKGANIIGATATPIRKGRNMEQLGNLYKELIQSVEIADLISDGYLSPARTYGSLIDVKGVQLSGGDYKADQLFDVYDKPFLYDGLIEHWNKFANGKKTIVFNINVEHSLKTRNAFRSAGISCEHVDGNTPKAERERILRDFKFGRFDVLCNVEILTTGYDEPSIGCVVVNRRTKSVPLWLQMCGRGSRIFKNKSEFIILDMGGNVVELGFWERRRNFSLWHAIKGSGVAPQKQCPDPFVEHFEDGSFKEYTRDELTPEKRKKHGCGSFVHASAPVCPDCGFEFPKNERKMIETSISEMIDGSTGIVEIPEHLQKPYSEMNFDELIQIAEIKGFKKHWILHQIEPTNENLNKFARLMGYKPNWIHFAKKNILNLKENDTNRIDVAI
jgi:superfamily II DNA or RNA helicase